MDGYFSLCLYDVHNLVSHYAANDAMLIYVTNFSEANSNVLFTNLYKTNLLRTRIPTPPAPPVTEMECFAAIVVLPNFKGYSQNVL